MEIGERRVRRGRRRGRVLVGTHRTGVWGKVADDFVVDVDGEADAGVDAETPSKKKATPRKGKKETPVKVEPGAEGAEGDAAEEDEF